jgi:hypothetical protein
MKKLDSSFLSVRSCCEECMDKKNQALLSGYRNISTTPPLTIKRGLYLTFCPKTIIYNIVNKKKYYICFVELLTRNSGGDAFVFKILLAQ